MRNLGTERPFGKAAWNPLSDAHQELLQLWMLQVNGWNVRGGVTPRSSPPAAWQWPRRAQLLGSSLEKGQAGAGISSGVGVEHEIRAMNLKVRFWLTIYSLPDSDMHCMQCAAGIGCIPDTSALETSKARLDGAPTNLFWWKASQIIAGGWTGCLSKSLPTQTIL